MHHSFLRFALWKKKVRQKHGLWASFHSEKTTGFHSCAVTSAPAGCRRDMWYGAAMHTWATANRGDSFVVMTACPHSPQQRQTLVSSEMGQETGCHVNVSCSTMSCVLVFKLKADAAIKPAWPLLSVVYQRCSQTRVQLSSWIYEPAGREIFGFHLKTKTSPFG